MAYPVSSLRSFLPSRDRPPPRTQAMRFNNSMPKEIMRANFNFMQVGRKGGGDDPYRRTKVQEGGVGGCEHQVCMPAGQINRKYVPSSPEIQPCISSPN